MKIKFKFLDECVNFLLEYFFFEKCQGPFIKDIINHSWGQAGLSMYQKMILLIKSFHKSDYKGGLVIFLK